METKEHGLYFAIRELHTFSERRGMLELRLRVLSFITDYLNQVNTQAMLVAGCAMSLLISSELTEVAANERGGSYNLLFDYMYVTFSCSCLASSLWVIYTSMNLVNLSTAALLQSTRESGIVECETLLLRRMGDVRLIFMVSLVCLVLAALVVIFEQLGPWFCAFCASLFSAVAWHAVQSDFGVVRQLQQRQPNIKIVDRWQASSLREVFERLQRVCIPYGYARHIDTIGDGEQHARRGALLVIARFAGRIKVARRKRHALGMARAGLTKGTLEKTRSTDGPIYLAEHDINVGTKFFPRFFELRSGRLAIYASDAEYRRDPAHGAKHVVFLHEYHARAASAGHLIALEPREACTADGKPRKSWYLRAPNAAHDQTHAWLRLLEGATAPV